MENSIIMVNVQLKIFELLKNFEDDDIDIYSLEVGKTAYLSQH